MSPGMATSSPASADATPEICASLLGWCATSRCQQGRSAAQRRRENAHGGDRPVRHDEALEPELVLQEAVEEVAVLAGGRSVDLGMRSVSRLPPWRPRLGSYTTEAERIIQLKQREADSTALYEAITAPTPARTPSANGHRYSSCRVRSSCAWQVSEAVSYAAGTFGARAAGVYRCWRCRPAG